MGAETLHQQDRLDLAPGPASCMALGLLADLENGGVLDLLPDERLWKLYCFRPQSGRATHLEHRIYTKRKPDGRLALVSFARHTPSEGRAVRSGIARVADLSIENLNQIVDAIRRQAGADQCEELDLSEVATLEEQLARIGQHQEEAAHVSHP